MEARRSGRVAADCKSVLKRLVGSNLTASTILFQSSTAVVQLTVNQLVVGSIPASGAKLRAVGILGNTPALHVGVRGSTPRRSTILI